MGALDDLWRGALGTGSFGVLSAAPFVAALLAGRLMTRGQHLARVADIVAGQVLVLAAKDAELVAARQAHSDLVASIGTAHSAEVQTLREQVAALVLEREYERKRADVQEQRAETWMGKSNELSREFGDALLDLATARARADSPPPAGA